MIDRINDWFAGAPEWTSELIAAALAATVAIAIALIVHRILFGLLKKLIASDDSEVDEIIIQQVAKPSRYALVALGIVVAAREIPALDQIWQKVAGFVMPALVGWIAIALLRALVRALELRRGSDLVENVDARKSATRLRIFSRLVTALIIFITVGLMLLSIPGVRDIGITLMASAGLAALAVGAAAQPALKSLIASLQMAVSEPVRIGDMVVVDGHTGRVEEIRMSYVLVRSWDERLLVVPPERFLEDTFENWSRKSEALTGPVFLHLDPSAEVAPIRAEFERYVGEHELWDKRTATLLLTEAYPESIELRLAVSAGSIGRLWNLRCAVREHMIGWLQREMPDALIRHRLEVPGGHEKANEPGEP